MQRKQDPEGTARDWMIALRKARYRDLVQAARAVSVRVKGDCEVHCSARLLEIVEEGGTTTPDFAEAIGRTYGMTRTQMQEIASRPLGTKLDMSCREDMALKRPGVEHGEAAAGSIKRTPSTECASADQVREMHQQGMPINQIKRVAHRGQGFVMRAICGDGGNGAAG